MNFKVAKKSGPYVTIHPLDYTLHLIIVCIPQICFVSGNILSES